MFEASSVNINLLKQRAYNLRWAAVPDGVIPLTAADPDFPCAPEIAEAIARFAADRYFSYGPADGLPEFKSSMADYFINKRNIATAPHLVFPVDSAAFGIYLTCKAYLNPGDEAIIFDPVDFLFRYSIETVGATAVPFAIPQSPGEVDFDVLEKLITSKTRMLCLCNPLNPTGKVFTKSELEKFGELACKYNLIILSDEIWSDIIYRPHVFTSIASLSLEIARRTVTITGFSKSYGLAGLRIGAVVAPDQESYQKLINASLHNSTIHGANIISQIAATAALNQCGYWLENFIDHLHVIRSICVNTINEIPGFKCILPEGCYVAFIDISGTKKTAKEIHQLLLEDAKVAVVPGLKEWFGEGAENYIRLSFATSEEIVREALSRIKNTINRI